MGHPPRRDLGAPVGVPCTMRVIPLAFVLVVVGCNGTTLVESADVPVVDVALDFNPTDARADAGGCPVGFTCTPTDAGTDVAPLDAGTDTGGTDAGLDVAPSPVDIGAADTGVDAQPVDTGVDVPRVDTGVDVPCTADTATDPNNCGGCGMSCPVPAGPSVVSCVAGACEWHCYPGWSHCNADAATGCETNTGGNDSTNCGGCGEHCSGRSYCQNGICIVP